MTTSELIAELAEIRAYEHRFDDFESLAERGRQIQDELRNGSTP